MSVRDGAVPSLPQLCGRAVEGARTGEDVEAYAGGGRHVDVRVRAGRVESFTSAETRGVGVRIVVDGRVGYAYAADPSLDEVGALVESARQSAAFAEPDEFNVLPTIEPAEPLPGLYHEKQEDVPAKRKVSTAIEFERAAVSANPDVRKVRAASIADAVSRVAIASTRGGPVSYERTDCWASVSAIAERDGEMQMGFEFALARDLDDLEWEPAARAAADRAARLLGGQKPKSERLPVVFDPGAATAFLSVLAGALSGEAVLKSRSPLAEMVGEQVGSAAVTLVDDGRRLDGTGSAPFDDEGVATGRTPLVEAGVLKGFLHNTYTGARSGSRSTGNAGRSDHRSVPGVSPTNLSFEPGRRTTQEILRDAGRAVYVQDVTGLHSGASSITGEFSVGATGLVVEGGSFGPPLREMTVASTLLEVLANVRELGSDLRFFPMGGSLGAPTILVGEMTVAGT